VPESTRFDHILAYQIQASIGTIVVRSSDELTYSISGDGWWIGAIQAQRANDGCAAAVQPATSNWWCHQLRRTIGASTRHSSCTWEISI